MHYFILCLLCMTMIDAREHNTKPSIVFDFGGVLGTTDKTHVEKFIQNGLGVSQNEAKSLIKGLHDAKAEGISSEQFWADYATMKGISLPSHWAHKVEEARADAITPNPKAIHYVKSLRKKGYSLSILSNVTKLRAQHIRSLGVYDLFRHVLLSYKLGVTKPDPRIYKILIKRLKVSPRQIIVIDDKKENILVAKSLGIRGILFTSLRQLKKDLPHLIKAIQHHRHHHKNQEEQACFSCSDERKTI